MQLTFERNRIKGKTREYQCFLGCVSVCLHVFAYNVVCSVRNFDRSLIPQYAHNEIVVTFLVVKIFGFWVIARNPLDEFRRK